MPPEFGGKWGTEYLNTQKVRNGDEWGLRDTACDFDCEFQLKGMKFNIFISLL